MSDSKIFAEYQHQDLTFLSVGHGSKKLTLLAFLPSGLHSGVVTYPYDLSPDEADAMADDMKHRAALIREAQKGNTDETD